MSNTNPLQLLRSSTANKRPLPAGLVDGRPAINTNSASPGLFFKDSAGALVKVGPVHVGATAPNASPASGGATGNSVGEQWLDTSGGTYVFKVWDGSAWRSESGTFVDVNGDVMTGALGIIAGSAGSPGIYFSGDTNTGLYSPGADQLAISTGGSGRLFVDASGTVLLAGGAVPGAGNSNPFLYRIGGGGLGLGAATETGTSAPILFYTAATERLRITSAGFVGVGTSSPSARLHVDNQVYIKGSASTDGETGIEITSGGSAVTTNSHRIRTAGGLGKLLYIETETVDSSGQIGFATNGSERLRIDSSGRVGIGTSAPGALFDVSGGGATGRFQVSPSAGTVFYNTLISSGGYGSAINDATQHIWYVGGAEAARIDSSGRLGIGTTSPGSIVAINDPGTGLGFINAASANFNIGLLGGAASNDAYIFQRANGPLIIGTNNAERARIDSSGRLLVGTSSAGSTLQKTIELAGAGTATSQPAFQVYSYPGASSPDNGYFQFYKSRGSSVGANTIVASGDRLGMIRWSGANGSGYDSAAEIYAEVDGTPGTNDMPGRLVFSTTADGASSPTERLRIDSAGQIEAGSLGTAAAPVWSFLSDPNTGIYSPGADQLAISTGGSGRLFVDASGNVGINNAADPTSILKLTQLSDATSGGIQLVSVDGNGAIISRLNDGGLTFRNGGFERLRITSAGLVGIGTSGPAYLLHLQNTSADTNAFVGQSSTRGLFWQWRYNATAGNAYGEISTYGSDNDLRIQTQGGGGNTILNPVSGRVGIGTASPGERLTVVGTDNSANFRVKGSSSNGDFFIYNNASTNQVALSTNLTTTDMAFAIGGNEAMKIDTSRRLLVGTSSSPSAGGQAQYAKFVIAGNTSSAVTQGILNITRGQAASSTIGADTEVGHINFTDSVGNEFARITCATDGVVSSASDLPGRLVFSTTADGASSPTERLRITSAGLVGVGTSSPSSALDVEGIITAKSGTFDAGGFQNKYGADVNSRSWWIKTDTHGYGDFAIRQSTTRTGSSYDTKLLIDNSGRVGIGTSSPTHALSVVDATAYRGISISGNNAPNVNFANGTAEWKVGISGNVGTSFSISKGASNDDKFSIDSSGRVGIGTTTVDEKLHVSGGNIKQQLAAATNGGLSVNNGTNDLIAIGTGGFAANGGSVTDGGIRAANSLVFATGSSTPERARIDSSGRLLVGTSSARNNFFNTTAYTPQVQVEGASSTGQTMVAITSSDLSLPSYLILSRQKSGAIGGNTIVSNNDGLGYITFQGSDGSEFVRAADIYAEVDGTPGTNDMPGRLVFSTTADGASSPTERLRITSAGNVGIGTTSPQATFAVSNGGAAGLEIYPSGFDSGPVIQSYNRSTLAYGPLNIYSSYFAFNIGTTERVRVDSSGRLLVGTSSSRYGRLQIEGTNDEGSHASITRNTNDDLQAVLTFNKTRGTTVSANTVVASGDTLGEIRFSGADGTSLVRAATIQALVDGTPGTNDIPGRLVFSTTADGATSPTERMRITSNGNVLINSDPATSARFAITGYATGDRVGIFMKPSGNNAVAIVFTNASGGLVGSITTDASATAYNTSSDYRLKENVTPVTDGITRLQQLKPSRFNFIANPGKTVDGFLAHEVQAIVPEAITGEKDAVDDEGNPQYQGIDQSKMVPLLTAALQEAITKIESLEARLTAAGI